MQQSKREKTISASTPRILALEGDKTNRFLLQKALTMNGYFADCVASAREILERLSTKNTSFDLIIINICAPINDDLKLVRSIRALPDHRVSTIPILATTTVMYPDIRKKCQDEGISDVLMKPFEIDELSRMIKQILTVRKKSLHIEV